MSGFKMRARKGVYQRRGKPFRWFVAVKVGDETRYQERLVALDGSPVSESRCMTWGAAAALEGQDWGEGQEVRTSLSFIPSQVTMKRGDLALITEPQAAMLASDQFRRSGSTHALPHWPCLSVEGVWVEGVQLAPSTYSVSEDGLTWADGTPEPGEQFFVRWRYLPLWQWSTDDRTHLQLGDTEAMPQRGQAILLRDFDKTLILPSRP